MNCYYKAKLLRSVLSLFVLLLPVASRANAISDDYPLTIKVIRSQTLPLNPDTTYVEGCNQADYSAYCMHSSSQFVQNKMVVTANDGKTFTIACTIESRWSNCVPLPEGESFRARIERNNSLSILYLGSNGRQRKQRYDVVPDNNKADAAARK